MDKADNSGFVGKLDTLAEVLLLVVVASGCFG